MSGRIYLDYAATTPVDERVVEAMAPFWSDRFGNPNSLYTRGRDAFSALEEARAQLASCLGAQEPREIVFTGGGTEADNAAVLGIAGASKRGKHVVVSAFEHHAVLEPAEQLARTGWEVSQVRPREDGVVHPEDLERFVREDTALVSIMAANNELGTVQPLRELVAVTHDAGAVFHTDGVQAVGKIPFDVLEIGVDAVSISAHKIYGPKGVGALYLRSGTPFQPLLRGGGQESKRRSGTQNVGGAAGLAKALSLMLDEQDAEADRLSGLLRRLETGVFDTVPNVELNGAQAKRLPNIANFIVKGAEGESMLLQLDAAGFEVATGSACSSASLEPSHVLVAIGCPPELAHGSLRVSLGRFTTEEQVDAFLEVLPPVVERLRSMSPVYHKTYGDGGR